MLAELTIYEEPKAFWFANILDLTYSAGPEGLTIIVSKNYEILANKFNDWQNLKYTNSGIDPLTIQKREDCILFSDICENFIFCESPDSIMNETNPDFIIRVEDVRQQSSGQKNR